MAPGLSADAAVLHIELVATHASVVYLPRFGVTETLSVAKWADVNVRFGHSADAALRHIKLVAAHASMVYSSCFDVT